MYQKHLDNIDYLNAIYQISGNSTRFRLSTDVASSDLSGRVVDPTNAFYETFDAQDCPDLSAQRGSETRGTANPLGLAFDELASSTPSSDLVQKTSNRIRRVPPPRLNLENTALISHSPVTPPRGPVFGTPESKGSPQIMVTPPTPRLTFSDDMPTPRDSPETPKDSPSNPSRLGDPIDKSSWRPRIRVSECVEVKSSTGLLPSPIARDPEAVPKTTRSPSAVSAPRRPKLVRGGRELQYDSPLGVKRSRVTGEGIQLLHSKVTSLRQGNSSITSPTIGLENTGDAGDDFPFKVFAPFPLTRLAFLTVECS